MAQCETPSKKRTDGQTRESNLVHFGLKMWHLVAIIVISFLIINLPNFVYLLVDPGFYPLHPPLNFYEASRFVPPYRMDARDKHNFVSSVRLLDWVWHIGLQFTVKNSYWPNWFDVSDPQTDSTNSALDVHVAYAYQRIHRWFLLCYFVELLYCCISCNRAGRPQPSVIIIVIIITSLHGMTSAAVATFVLNVLFVPTLGSRQKSEIFATDDTDFRSLLVFKRSANG